MSRLSEFKTTKLVVFSANYPFGNTETFLANEIQHLSSTFEKIIIIPSSYPKGIMKKRPLARNVTCFPPYLSKSVTIRILRSIFNCAPGIEFFVDFFVRAIFSSKISLLNWSNNLICFRTFLSSKHCKVLEKIIETEDILYFYWGFGSTSFIPYLKTKNRIVLRLHGDDAYAHRNNTYNYLPLRKRIYDRVDCILTISDNLRNYLISSYSRFNLERKIIVSRLGTNDYGINPEDYAENLTIVSCSYLIPIKRVELIVESLMLIKDRKITWHHFGDGYLWKEINSRCELLPSNITAILHGYLSNNELLKFYRDNHVDLFVNVSSTEGVPVSIMEAMSGGIIPVATNVGDTKELVDKDCGYLLDIDFSNEELSLIISNIRKDDYNVRRKLSRAKWELLYNAEINYRKLSRLILGHE